MVLAVGRDGKEGVSAQCHTKTLYNKHNYCTIIICVHREIFSCYSIFRQQPQNLNTYKTVHFTKDQFFVKKSFDKKSSVIYFIPYSLDVDQRR